MSRLAPLLLAYDAECALCRRMMDWVQRRDSWGLIVTFPLQNPELVRVAPELAGLPLHLRIHGLDTATREVWAGAELLPRVGARLPGWHWASPLLRIPGAARLASRLYLAISGRRHLQTGRHPFQR